jgi:hypothetical protein
MSTPTHPLFREMIAALDPTVQVPSRSTVRRDIASRFSQLRKHLRGYLASVDGPIHAQFDLWSQGRYALMAVLVRVHSGRELQTLLLDLVVLQDRHTGEAVASALKKVLDDYRIMTKVCSSFALLVRA